jgi:hypothetical protein
MVCADTQALLADTDAALAGDAHREGHQRRWDRAESCRQLGAALTTYRALSTTLSEAAQDVRHSGPKLEACRQDGAIWRAGSNF